ncbi:MAG: hypothetical protein ACOX6W_15655 [Lentisphaeria bacterium]
MKFFSGLRSNFAGIIDWCLSSLRHISPPRALVLAATMIGSLTYAGLMVRHKDDAMRQELLMQTQLLASAIPQNLVQALSGTSDDLERPEYHRLKKILQALQQQAPEYYFI